MYTNCLAFARAFFPAPPPLGLEGGRGGDALPLTVGGLEGGEEAMHPWMDLVCGVLEEGRGGDALRVMHAL